MSLMDVGSFTVEDLRTYREQREDMTVQLLDGELVVSPSPSWQHQVVHSNLFALLAGQLPEHLIVISAPMDLRVGERSVLQPDLMVLDRSHTFETEVTVPPLLAVEILSPASQSTDLVRKPEVLARFGCEHYWVIDPVRPAIRVFHRVGDNLVAGSTATGDDVVALDEPFEVRLRPSDLIR